MIEKYYHLLHAWRLTLMISLPILFINKVLCTIYYKLDKIITYQRTSDRLVSKLNTLL